MSGLITARVRGEALANLRLAGPLIAAQMAGVGMGTVDTIMAGRLGARELAAVAVGANFNVIFFVFFMGVLLACSPIVAQRAGAGRADRRAGPFVREALCLAVLLGTCWTLLLQLLAEPVLTRLGLPDETAQLACDYLRALSFSGVPLCLWFVLRFTAEGVAQPRPILLAGIIGLATNALFNWLLMYGHWGLPRLGAEGCGWATTIATATMAACMALPYRLAPRLVQLDVFGPGAWRPRAGAREVLQLGLPIGLILVAEAGLFAVAALLMARFGERAVAAYQVAINFASVVFMIPLGIALATTVRVGHAIGAGHNAEAVFRGKVGMALSVANAASNSLIMALCASPIVALYTRDPQIAATAAGFLWLAAVFQFFDGLQVSANGALRGIKDTRVPMVVTVCAYWLAGFPVAWWLAFHTGAGAAGIWWGLTAGLMIAAAGLSWRFIDKAPRVSAQATL